MGIGETGKGGNARKTLARTFVQQRVDVWFNHQLPFALALAKIHYVLDEILDVLSLGGDAFRDFSEQFYLFRVFSAYVSDANYVRSGLEGRRKKRWNRETIILSDYS